MQHARLETLTDDSVVVDLRDNLLTHDSKFWRIVALSFEDDDAPFDGLISLLTGLKNQVEVHASEVRHAGKWPTSMLVPPKQNAGLYMDRKPPHEVASHDPVLVRVWWQLASAEEASRYTPRGF